MKIAKCRFPCLLAVLMAGACLQAQKTPNSPYSMYGIGDSYRNGFSYQRAMGGIATGMRTANEINYLNPASYTSQDTMSFIFDMGASFNYRNLSSLSSSTRDRTITMDYLAGAFPVTRWWYSSFGLVPYSRTGYHIASTGHLPGISDTIPLAVQYTYKGNGGIYQAYWGNAISLLKHFSIGVNIGYLFGSLNEDASYFYPSSSSFYKTYRNLSTRIGSFYYETGFQAYGTIAGKHTLTAGITWNGITSLNARRDTLCYRSLSANDINNDTIIAREGSKTSLEIPSTLGMGLSYAYNKQITAGVDVYRQSYQQHSTYPVRIGIEITPNPASIRSYFEKVHYRLGFQHTPSYYLIDGRTITDTRISAGIGLPFIGSKNEFNLAFEIGRRGTTNGGLISDRYCFVSCSFRFYEFWFFRRKYD